MDKSSIKPSERKAPVQKQEDRRELRKKKIQEAIDLKVGKEPPLKQEIVDALDLLKRIAETSAETSNATTTTTTTTVVNVINAAIPLDSNASILQITKIKFKNCSEVNKIYPWGVAKTLAATKKRKRSSFGVSFISASLYRSLSRMDKNKDLIACER